MYSFLLFFPLSPLSPFTLSLFSSLALHHITPAPQHIRLQPTLISHIVSTPHTKGPPFPFSFFLFPFVCGVGVVRGMSLGCKWMFCGAGSLPLFSSFPFLSIFLFPLFLGGRVGWVGQWVCVCWVGSPDRCCCTSTW